MGGWGKRDLHIPNIMVVHFLQHSYTQMFQYSKNDMEHVGINMGVCPVNLYISLIFIYIMGGINNPNGTEWSERECF